MTPRQKALTLGWDRYFTGLSCKRGHTVKRYVKDRRCVKCASMNDKERHAKNPELVRQRMRNWCARNKKLHNQKSQNWRVNNPERAREINRKSNAKRYRENLEEARVRNASHWARQVNAVGCYTPEDVRELISKQRGICAAPSCSHYVRTDYHIDHMVPLSCGGSNWPKNLQILCPTCNMKKSDKPYDLWLTEERKTG